MAVTTLRRLILVIATLVIAIDAGDVALFVTKTVTPRMFARIAVSATVLACILLFPAFRALASARAKKEI